MIAATLSPMGAQYDCDIAARMKMFASLLFPTFRSDSGFGLGTNSLTLRTLPTFKKKKFGETARDRHRTHYVNI